MSDWFNHCQTLEEARAEYRRLCFQYHPDYGGQTELMQAINAAYERFKRDWRPRPAPQAQPRNPTQWSRPAYRPPRPSQSSPRSQPARREPHSRAALHSIWSRQPWRLAGNGSFVRQLWDHTVTLFQHPSPKYHGAWFVLLDGELNPYSYDSRLEAEHDAFELLYEKVKYHDL